MNWRKWNYAIHRDLGFLCIGLTLLYALSGIAVNHIQDWNPNYVIEKIETQIPPIASGALQPEAIPPILQRLGEKNFQNAFQPDQDNLWIYLDKRMIRINLPSGTVQQEVFKRRPFWYPLNYLHLNHPKKSWTWVADIYAGGLFLLAFSGLLMLPKKKGPKKFRALTFMLAGFAIPIIFLLLYY